MGTMLKVLLLILSLSSLACDGIHGNFLVKVVEFTPKVQARSLFVFGQSNDPASDHYFDQAELYSVKEFKPAWFHPVEVEENARQTYTVRIPVGLK